MYVQLGCGDRVLDGFVNLDFLPHDERVHAWNLLDLWPESWAGVADGVFSEDVLEHFFYGEQAYILCNVNRALRERAVARTLMPSLSRLVDYGAAYSPTSRDVMYTAFGVDTGGDALNMGMRFGGHRWLHTQQSLARLAQMCGFEAESTTCARSSVERFAGINLRGENDSLAFANDLHKKRNVARTILAPDAIDGARHVEEVSDGMHVFVVDRRSSDGAVRAARKGGSVIVRVPQRALDQPLVVPRAQPEMALHQRGAPRQPVAFRRDAEIAPLHECRHA